MLAAAATAGTVELEFGRYLPHDFPPHATVYGYFALWSKEGIFTELSLGRRTHDRLAHAAPPPRPRLRSAARRRGLSLNGHA